MYVYIYIYALYSLYISDTYCNRPFQGGRQVPRCGTRHGTWRMTSRSLACHRRAPSGLSTNTWHPYVPGNSWKQVKTAETAHRSKHQGYHKITSEERPVTPTGNTGQDHVHIATDAADQLYTFLQFSSRVMKCCEMYSNYFQLFPIISNFINVAMLSRCMSIVQDGISKTFKAIDLSHGTTFIFLSRKRRVVQFRSWGFRML